MDCLLASMPEEAVAVIAVSGGFVVALVAIIGGYAKSFSETKEREKTKREIAAYIAEGTMTPDDAEKILRAGPGSKPSC